MEEISWIVDVVVECTPITPFFNTCSVEMAAYCRFTQGCWHLCPLKVITLITMKFDLLGVEAKELNTKPTLF
jgi:hypothetical protein